MFYPPASTIFGVLDFIVKYFVPVSGGVLGYVTFFGARRQKKRSAQAEKQDWDLYAALVAASKEGRIYRPEVGSADYKRADRLRQKGLLKREPAGVGFIVPGQQFTVEL